MRTIYTEDGGGPVGRSGALLGVWTNGVYYWMIRAENWLNWNLMVQVQALFDLEVIHDQPLIFEMLQYLVCFFLHSREDCSQVNYL